MREKFNTNEEAMNKALYDLVYYDMDEFFNGISELNIANKDEVENFCYREFTNYVYFFTLENVEDEVEEVESSEVDYFILENMDYLVENVVEYYNEFCKEEA